MTSRDQVERMLTLVPYLRNRNQIPVSEVADAFGVTVRQIVLDLNALWFCGLPGGMPGDLIDIDMEALEEDGVVQLDNADYLPRPPRLRTAEAVALQVALRAIRQTAPSEQFATIDSLAAKLEAAMDGSTPTPVGVQINRGDPEVYRLFNEAVRDNTRLRIRYASESRDEITDRTIEPMTMFAADGRTFSRSWCLASDDWRLFRLDRVLDIEATGDRATRRDEPERRTDVFSIGDEAPWAVLELAPDAWHIAELPNAEPVTTHGDPGPDRKIVTLPGASLAWLRRLVLAHAGDVRVLEPAELAADVANRARRALAAYDSHTHNRHEEK